MLSLDFIGLYVENVQASTAFYQGLFGIPPAESSPNFSMFPMANGALLGLWAGHDVQPAPKGAGGGSELGFTVKDMAEVDSIYREWSGKGITIAQTPIRMDFGFTFTALDPDGHRLRVFAPEQMPA